MADLRITRTSALAFRQRTNHLEERLPADRLEDVAFAGLQDSAPRSAVLSLHARMRGVVSSGWERPEFVQVWGPRGAVYVVLRDDVAVFTLGLLPRDRARRRAIDGAAERVRRAYRGGKGESATGSPPASRSLVRDLRTASATGEIRIRWDGSTTTWWLVDPPPDEPESARLELARRFLRSLGPSTPEGFAWWSGGTVSDARQTFRSLQPELLPVELEHRTAWVRLRDRSNLEKAMLAAVVRLLPPGDPYLGAADRALLLPSAGFRNELWPKSVWPGALFVAGELVGTWRRQEGKVTIQPWRKVPSEVKGEVEEEVHTMPIESATKEVRWDRPQLSRPR